MNKKTAQELQKEIEVLKAANTAKTELISVSSHQLRTSLSAVKWILKMFEDGDFGKMSVEQLQMIHKARESNERMVDLVNDVLNVSHFDSPETHYNFEMTQIADMVQEVVYEFGSEAKKKQIKISYEHPEQMPPLVSIDPEKIRVVIQNLVENALKYTGVGGEISIILESKDSIVSLTVIDNGIGIPDESISHIFEKFYRAKNAQKHMGSGSGLGLYISKNILSHHNGNIKFEKNPKGGTIFTISLPSA